eukprot:2462425-Prymnesium_polylepis.1
MLLLRRCARPRVKLKAARGGTRTVERVGSQKVALWPQPAHLWTKESPKMGAQRAPASHVTAKAAPRPVEMLAHAIRHTKPVSWRATRPPDCVLHVPLLSTVRRPQKAAPPACPRNESGRCWC